jgi:hypothetical protein
MSQRLWCSAVPSIRKCAQQPTQQPHTHSGAHIDLKLPTPHSPTLPLRPSTPPFGARGSRPFIDSSRLLMRLVPLPCTSGSKRESTLVKRAGRGHYPLPTTIVVGGGVPICSTHSYCQFCTKTFWLELFSRGFIYSKTYYCIICVQKLVLRNSILGVKT